MQRHGGTSPCQFWVCGAPFGGARGLTRGGTGCASCVGSPPGAPPSAVALGGTAKRGPPEGARDLSAAVLAPLTTTGDECAEGLNRETGEPCASAPVLRAVIAFAGQAGPGPPRSDARERGSLPTAETREAVAVRAAAAELGCTSESCVLTHPRFLSFAGSTGALPEAGKAVQGDLDLRFKAKGPRYGRALLSNYNIDATLQRWARAFEDFYPCPFAMMDFESNGDFFGEVDLLEVLDGRVPADLGPGIGEVSRRATCFGCVLNTDTSRGPGKHWVAVFVDCRPGCEAPPGSPARAREGGPGPWTVEYFNSAGRPPDRPVVRWMERTRARLLSRRAGLPGCQSAEVISVPVTDLGHQESQTECGLYALYYIRRRLEGGPYTFFRENLIPDEAMTDFRQHVFRAS